MTVVKSARRLRRKISLFYGLKKSLYLSYVLVRQHSDVKALSGVWEVAEFTQDVDLKLTREYENLQDPSHKI